MQFEVVTLFPEMFGSFLGRGAPRQGGGGAACVDGAR